MTAARDEPRCYAVRRVNPFDGVLQIVETHAARAYSHDGRVWQIQVLTERPDHTWRSFSTVAPVEQFFNFGLWDADDGLHKIPANPVMDIGGMTRAAQRLCDTLATLTTDLPFALIDDYECWSTDYHGHPVALLATTERADLMQDLRIGRWQATRVADHGFVSTALIAHDIPAHGPLGPREHAERLERQVRQLGQHKAWFRRRDDGSGERLSTAAGPAENLVPLPALGLVLDWQHDLERALVEDYVAWLAPRLLLLQHIDDATRTRLEHLACQDAVELAARFRLLPRIVDTARLEAARVEARLRRAAR